MRRSNLIRSMLKQSKLKFVRQQPVRTNNATSKALKYLLGRFENILPYARHYSPLLIISRQPPVSRNNVTSKEFKIFTCFPAISHSFYLNDLSNKVRSKIMQKMHIGNFAEGDVSAVYCIWMYSLFSRLLKGPLKSFTDQTSSLVMSKISMVRVSKVVADSLLKVRQSRNDLITFYEITLSSKICTNKQPSTREFI